MGLAERVGPFEQKDQRQSTVALTLTRHIPGRADETEVAGLGLRVFISRWFAFNVAVKDYAYPEKLENLEVDEINPGDKSSWLDSSASFTQNVELQAGLSIFVPFSFDYRLPK